jgi:TetR/AcrR family transcriptional regulator, fatty acid metabolism regulator protein
VDLTKRQNEILQASIKLIAEGGIQHFTTKALALELGVSEPAIYRHYKNKQEILLTILSIFKEDTGRFKREIKREEASLKQIERMFVDKTEQFTVNPALTAVIFSEEIFQNDRQLAEMVLSIMNERHQAIHSVIEKVQTAGEIRRDISAHQLTLIIMGTLRLIISKWNLTGYGFDLKSETAEAWQSLKCMMVQ